MKKGTLQRVIVIILLMFSIYEVEGQNHWTTMDTFPVPKRNGPASFQLDTDSDGIADKIRACNFSAFLKRVQEAIDEPQMESVLADTVENFGLQTGRSLLTRLHGVEIASNRTQLLLDKFGITWPEIPQAGKNALLSTAMKFLTL